MTINLAFGIFFYSSILYTIILKINKWWVYEFDFPTMFCRLLSDYAIYLHSSTIMHQPGIKLGSVPWQVTILPLDLVLDVVRIPFYIITGKVPPLKYMISINWNVRLSLVSVLINIIIVVNIEYYNQNWMEKVANMTQSPNGNKSNFFYSLNLFVWIFR